MPRTLPWATSRKPSTDIFTALPTPGTSKRRRSQPDTDLDSDTPIVPPRRQQEFNKHYPGVTGVRPRDRSPSTSPPPSPPDLEFMSADAQDDAWVMVEDEFMSTAQQFTKHLHHAAYQQRKAEAAQRRLSARTTAPRDASQVKTHLVEKLAMKHGQTIERAGSEEAEEGDDLIIGDRRLARLMFANGVGGKGKTRLDGLVHTTTSRGHEGLRTKPTKQRIRVNKEDAHEDDTDELIDNNSNLFPERLPAQKQPDRRSAHPPDHAYSSSSRPGQPSDGLGFSIFGRSKPDPAGIPDEACQHRSPTQTHHLDEDGLPMRRQAPSLAELRQERAVRKVNAEFHESFRRPPIGTPDTLRESATRPIMASPSARDRVPRRLKEAKEESTDTQEVVPLFL